MNMHKDHGSLYWGQKSQKKNQKMFTFYLLLMSEGQLLNMK